MADPSDDELKVTIRKLIPKVNLQKTGIKAFIKLLSKECGGIDLKPRSDYIKKELSAAINEMEDSSSESESEEEAPKPKKKRAAGKGLSIKKEISEDLANFLGHGRQMARTEIVKELEKETQAEKERTAAAVSVVRPTSRSGWEGNLAETTSGDSTLGLYQEERLTGACLWM
jgi:hypothetical protein